MREINVKSVAFTHDYKYLVFIVIDRGFTMWNIKEKKEECYVYGRYEYMAISSNGQYVLLHVASFATTLFNIKMKSIALIAVKTFQLPLIAMNSIHSFMILLMSQY